MSTQNFNFAANFLLNVGFYPSFLAFFGRKFFDEDILFP